MYQWWNLVIEAGVDLVLVAFDVIDALKAHERPDVRGWLVAWWQDVATGRVRADDRPYRVA